MTDFYTELYDECLLELKERSNWSSAFEPILAQYVFNMTEANRLMLEIQGESVEVEHTNKASHTNKATSPKWRMFLELTKAAAALAKDLQLNPATSPVKVKAKSKGFKLTREAENEESYMTKFRLGDQVRVVNYGHQIFSKASGEIKIIDISPEVVGCIGIISNAHQTQGEDAYAIEGIRYKSAWYDNGQLELIHRPEYKTV